MVLAEKARKEKEGGEEEGFDGLSIGLSKIFGRLWELTGCGGGCREKAAQLSFRLRHGEGGVHERFAQAHGDGVGAQRH